MAKSKPALGTGLGALIGAKKRPLEDLPPAIEEVAPREGAEPSIVEEVPLDRIRPSPQQPRRTIADEQLDELVESIREHGVIQPLVVRPQPDHLELIAGERRWRACRKLGLATVPVIRRKATDQEVLEMALIENLQREDLNPIEEALAYTRLAKEFGLRQEDIAQRVGKRRATVANAMRLLDLHQEVQGHLTQGRISTGHAKVILSLKDHDTQKKVAEQIIRQGLTVRGAEALVIQIARGKTGGVSSSGSGSGREPLSSALVHIENTLREAFSTQVRLVNQAKKGRIEIEYYGEDDLQRLLELWGVAEEE